MNKPETFSAIKWERERLTLLDQRKLPHQIVYCHYDSANMVADAIKTMVVRGAPAIGIAAAYAVVLAARTAYQDAGKEWRRAIETELAQLQAARPTAVNLQWAIAKMQTHFDAINDDDPTPLLLALAQRIHQDDITANHAMGRLGASLIEPASQVVTHCNAGALATGGYGTALGVVRTAYHDGLLDNVFVAETRPWLQGARLTCWELQQDDIPVSLLIDSAVASQMQVGNIQWLIVGADRISANADVANKIGTYAHAICAKHHGVKVMVVAPTSTIDLTVVAGANIPIEHRPTCEITQFNATQIAPAGIVSINPAFDITPAALIDVLVTEKAIVAQPNHQKMLALFG